MYLHERPLQMGHHQAQEGRHRRTPRQDVRPAVKNIEVAARIGGGDPAGNPTLYDAIQKAKKNSVPNDNIERARKRGAGEEAGGADWQTITYEGYGPNGVAVLIECLTDNRNRAAGEVRVAMTRNGGNMADPGSVAYLFSRKGVVTLEKNGLTEDDVLTAVLDAGAEDVNDLDDSFEIVCEPGDLVAVRTALQDAGIDYESAEASFQPSVTVPVDLDGARKVLKLIDALEDSDDVQDVYTNVDIPDEVAAELDERNSSTRRRRLSTAEVAANKSAFCASMTPRTPATRTSSRRRSTSRRPVAVIRTHSRATHWRNSSTGVGDAPASRPTVGRGRWRQPGPWVPRRSRPRRPPPPAPVRCNASLTSCFSSIGNWTFSFHRGKHPWYTPVTSQLARCRPSQASGCRACAWASLIQTYASRGLASST